MSTPLPSKTGAPPSSSGTLTASSKSAGAGGLSDGQISRDGRFRWNAVWGVWTPTGREEEVDLPGPLEFGPLMPEPLHRRGCGCQACWDAGLRYGEYLKAKKIRETNGFI